MNTKQRDFLISNTIVVVFTVLLTLIIYNFLIARFGFNQETFYPITLILLLFATVFYSVLSKSLLQPLFKSEKEIQNLIKETLHEINTPVATIKMNTKILQKKEENSKNLERLERIDTSCDNLLDLYRQMEYTLKEKIDSVTVECFDIDEIIKKSMKKFQDIKKEIQIEYQSQSLIVEVDKNGFEKVIDNLLANGIKYNKPNGKITIFTEENILKISDTGIGIDTKNLFHIFDKYYQENSLSEGIGLGLNIVKAYCDKYKIDLKIDSTKDVGSVFSLDLKGIMWQSNK